MAVYDGFSLTRRTIGQDEAVAEQRLQFPQHLKRLDVSSFLQLTSLRYRNLWANRPWNPATQTKPSASASTPCCATISELLFCAGR